MKTVGIIGCGKVADKHIRQIQRIKDCAIIGVCDQEPLMAEQLSERINIKHNFNDVGSFLSTCKPDIVHITTPPQSHYSLTKQCLEAGCHVYVEKPFTLNSNEAKELIDTAVKKGRKITVGHETQFMPVARDMRRLINSGYLGGPPVHMESIYCYDFSDERYAKAVMGDKNHWIRRLPGGLLQNIISHGIGKIVEYFKGNEVDVYAKGFTSDFLEGINEHSIMDELRVIITDDRKTTAYFTFSSQMSPALHQFRIHGPKNSLFADHEHQILIKLHQQEYKSFLNQFIPPFKISKQYRNNGVRNIKRFLKSEFHAESGLYVLVNKFYKSLDGNCPLPIPYKDILLTATIMDRIFSQITK